MKFLRKKSRIHLDIKCDKFFFDPPVRIMKNKTKINKSDLTPLKSAGTPQETINTMKRQSTEMGENTNICN